MKRFFVFLFFVVVFTATADDIQKIQRQFFHKPYRKIYLHSDSITNDVFDPIELSELKESLSILNADSVTGKLAGYSMNHIDSLFTNRYNKAMFLPPTIGYMAMWRRHIGVTLDDEGVVRNVYLVLWGVFIPETPSSTNPKELLLYRLFATVEILEKVK